MASGKTVRQGPGKRHLRTVLYVVPVVLLVSVGQQLARTRSLRDWTKLPSRLERVGRKYQEQIEGSAALKARLAGRNREQGRALARELTQAGLKRLPAVDLEKWNQIR